MLRLLAVLPVGIAARAPADGASGTLGAQVVGAHEIAPGAVGLDHMADLSGGRLIGRAPGATGAPVALDPAQARLVIDAAGPAIVAADVASAEALSPAPAVTAIRTLGRDWPGDGGGALWLRAPAQPVHPGRFMTADGTWWVLGERAPTPEMFGAAGDGLSNDLSAILAARDYCAEAGVPLHLTSPDGYAISDEIRIDTGNFSMIGAGTGRPSLRALAPAARVSVGRAAECRLVGINFDGAHPATGVWTAQNAFVALARGGRDTGITGANSLTLDRCRAENTRGSALRVLRDATEVRVWGCTFRRVGRIDETLSGAARFVDGHPPMIDWQGNGSIVNTVLSGGAGFAIEVSAGPPDDFGVFEEVQLRARNVRAQNGFLGLLRVRDWSGSGARTSLNSAEIPVTVTWSGGYLENPGTVQDSTTSGGSPVTQGSGDDVVTVLAEGAMTRVVIDAPVKIMNRRARAAFRATQGAMIDADLRGNDFSSTRLGNVSDDRIICHAGDGPVPGTIKLRSLPSIWGAKAADAASLGDMLDWTQIARSPAGAGRAGVLAPGARLLRALLDGASTAPIGATGRIASMSLAAGQGPAGGGAVELACDPGAPAGPCFAVLPFVAPAHWAGLWVMVESLVRWRQIGADFGGAGGVRHALRVSDPVNWAPGSKLSSGVGPIFPDMTETAELSVPAPGPNQWTPWRVSRVMLRVLRAGPAEVTVFLDAGAAQHAQVAQIGEVRLSALDGEGA